MSSLVGRLAKTPLRDALRGRLTCRLDVRGAIAAADLPAPVAALVATVVRRTRLWRLERAEVAEELIAHFGDGLAAGAGAEMLVEQFGDAARAAKLIRRAKKRSRPWPWRAAWWTVRGALALLVVYMGVGVHFLVGRVDPSVDYRPLLNEAALAVPEGERAWPVYREALMGGAALPKFEGLSRAPRPGEDGWERAEAYLQANAEVLDLARRGAARPGLGFVVGRPIEGADAELWPELARQQAEDAGSSTDELWKDSLIGLLLPHVGRLRELAGALALDADRAAAAGEGEAFVADVEAMLGIARHVRETPVFIGDLVALSVLSRASRTLDDALVEHPETLTDAQLARLAHRLAAAAADIEVRYDGERYMFYDIMQRLYTDDGDGDGRLTLEGARALMSIRSVSGWASGWSSVSAYDALAVAALPMANAVMLSRREMTREYDRLMDRVATEARQPLWLRDRSSVDEQLEQWGGDPIESIRRLPIVFLMPAVSKLSITDQIAHARADATLAAVAAELFRRRHGRWPASLEELVPQLMPEAPIDRFDGRPLRFVLRDGAPVIYSVGTDRDDDGGVAPAGDAGAAMRWLPPSRLEATSSGIPDGDWIIWPAPREPLYRYE